MTEEELLSEVQDLLIDFQDRMQEWSPRQLKHLQLIIFNLQTHVDTLVEEQTKIQIEKGII